MTLTPEQWEAAAKTLATILQQQRELFLAFEKTTREAAANIEDVLTFLDGFATDAGTEPAVAPDEVPERVAVGLDAILRQHLTAFTTVTGGLQPGSVAVTTAYREHLHRVSEDVGGRKISKGALDSIWGIPVVVDDTIPEKPGFKILPVASR